MKKTKYILVSLLTLSAMTSCDDFLNEQPQSDITRQPLAGNDEVLVSDYKNVDDAQNALNGAYSLLKSDIYQLQNFVLGDCMSDNCYAGSDATWDIQYDELAVSSVNENVKNIWSQYYAVAGAATKVIEHLRIIDPSRINQSDKMRIIAEAKVLRAWAYFDIVRIWGDAPLSLKMIPSITTDNIDKWYSEIYPERSSAGDIYDSILDDLSDETIASLPSSNHGSVTATKGMAYGLRAKVKATRGQKSERDYQGVVNDCDAVINEGYRLVDDFDSLWTVEGKLSSESVFELYFDSTNGNWAYWCLLSDESGSIVVSWRRYCPPTHDLLKKFDQVNDRRYKSSFVWHNVPYNQYYSASNYPLAYKIRQKDNDIILLRLADIMLLKAEALVELNRSGDAIDIVNIIRNRAGLQNLNRAMSQSDARLAVENERQLELVLEGQRWFDLVRNDRMEEVMQRVHDKNGNLRFPKVDSFRRLLPIPQGQIDMNERLTQNPGY